MSYKVAFASTDGKVVNEHFGRARQFHIVEIDDKDYKLERIYLLAMISSIQKME